MKTAITQLLLVGAMMAANCAFAASRAESTEAVKQQLAALAAGKSSNGGFATKQGKGRFAVVGCANTKLDDAVESSAKTLGGQLKFPIDVLTSGESVDALTAHERMKSLGLTVGVFIVNDPKQPMSLVAIEERWAIINLAKLLDGAMNGKAKRHRFGKELSRVAKALFSGVDLHKDTLAVSTGKDLDAVTSDPFDATTLVMVARGLPSYGLVAPRTVPYRRAVREGWAPAPTNDVQKAIWEEIKNPASRWDKDFKGEQKK